MAKRTGIVICDKSRLFREGVASLLQQSQFRIHTVFTDLDELHQRLVKPTRGLIFLLGAHSASDFDIQEIANLKRAHPDCHVLLLINHCAEELRWQAAHFGLDGVLLKSISSEVLCLSMDLVLKGQSVFIVNTDPSEDEEAAEAPGARSGTFLGFEDPATSKWQGPPVAADHAPAHSPLTMISSRREGLSDRELEILDCLVNGHSNKMIARRCNITDATVKAHLKAILRKISVANRTQAAVWAINRMHDAAAAQKVAASQRLSPGKLDADSCALDVKDEGERDICMKGALDPPSALAVSQHQTHLGDAAA